MSNIVTYSCKEGVATITMDDGKVNALSHTVWDELEDAFDKVENLLTPLQKKSFHATHPA